MGINRRTFLKQAGLAAASIPALSLSGLAKGTRRNNAVRPNILLILADDLGCYGSEIETPNLGQWASFYPNV